MRFLTWVPLGYIFETNLISLLVDRFLANPLPIFRNVTLKCLVEIAIISESLTEYNEKLVNLFMSVLQHVKTIVPFDQDLTEIYELASDQDQQFIQNLSLFLAAFLSFHIKTIESVSQALPQSSESLQIALIYMLRITQVKEREVFKACIEYWGKYVKDLFEEIHTNVPDALLGIQRVSRNFRRQKYINVLSRLRKVMIERMLKPEEVLIVENDEGEIVREIIKESDSILVYKSMKEILVYLTHLDVSDTESIMLDKLSRQMDQSEYSWENLNTLCWAVGSISGAMGEEVEKKFIVNVLKDLLGLCEMVRGKDNKAVVASNIMYVVGQYPRFLRNHWKFLKTVINKLFEFMHESHEGFYY